VPFSQQGGVNETVQLDEDRDPGHGGGGACLLVGSRVVMGHQGAGAADVFKITATGPVLFLNYIKADKAADFEEVGLRSAGYSRRATMPTTRPWANS
jgi:hypothetical protein